MAKAVETKVFRAVAYRTTVGGREKIAVQALELGGIIAVGDSLSGAESSCIDQMLSGLGGAGLKWEDTFSPAEREIRDLVKPGMAPRRTMQSPIDGGYNARINVYHSLDTTIEVK